MDRHREVTYVLDGAGLAEVAGAVAAALDVNLHEHRSPMVGPWYSDRDPGTITAVVEAARSGDSSAHGPRARVVLTTNDPEPGVVPVDVASGGRFVLRLWVHPHALDDVEARLQQRGAAPRRVE